MSAMTESLSMLELAQQATVEELASGLATATDDATTRAAESRSKTGGTGRTALPLPRQQLPCGSEDLICRGG